MSGSTLNSIEGTQSSSLLRVVGIVSVCALVGLLTSREMSAWRKFDWAVFYANLRYISIRHSLLAVVLTYAGLFLRAVRWKVFLRSLKPVPTARLFGSTIMGFAGLALLGRAGELVRPYLIARKEELSVSSQIAVLALERIFDTAAAGLLIATALCSSSVLQFLPYREQFRRGSLLLIVVMGAAAILALVLARNGQRLGSVLERILLPLSGRLAGKIGGTASAFCADLNRIQDAKSLGYISMLSILIWLFIALAHLESIHAFSSLRYISLADALLLLGLSLLGSLAQLPAGGTQQLIFIVALINVFGVPTELAVSCSILGWLTIFMIPVPVGLALLPLTHSSLHGLLQTGRQGQPA